MGSSYHERQHEGKCLVITSKVGHETAPGKDHSLYSALFVFECVIFVKCENIKKFI